MPDFTHPSALSAVFNRFLYSFSHDIDILVRSLKKPSVRLHATPGRLLPRTPQRHSKLLCQKTFQASAAVPVPHDFDGAVHYCFTLQEIPEVFLGEHDGLHNFTQRNALFGPPGANLAIALLNVEFILAEKPFA